MGAREFGPPPRTTFDVYPSQAEVEFFEENGYLVVERLTTDEEIAWLREIFEHIFSPEQAKARGAPLDRSGTRQVGEPIRLQQSFFPEMQYPELLHTNHHRNARRYAAALLGVDESKLSCWGHMIRKPPGGRPALWHQDHAYWLPELDYRALGVWLPMHDVSVEMGAMQFIPGSHKRGLMKHRHADKPEHNNLIVDEYIDESTAVACPLKAGGATFHHCETLHYTAPNATNQDRLAFPMEFQIAPVRRAKPYSMPWVEERRAVVPQQGPLTYVANGKLVEV